MLHLPLPLPLPLPGFHKQYQLTLLTIDKSNSQSGDYLAKVLKQKLYVSELAMYPFTGRLCCVGELQRVGGAVCVLVLAVPRSAWGWELVVS